MKRKIGITLYPFLFGACLLILIMGMTGIAIRALLSEGVLWLIKSKIN